MDSDINKFMEIVKPRPILWRGWTGVIGLLCIINTAIQFVDGQTVSGIVFLCLGIVAVADMVNNRNYYYDLENPEAGSSRLYQVGDVKFVGRSDLEAELYSELYHDSEPVKFIEYINKF
jgi:hypothetical protein